MLPNAYSDIKVEPMLHPLDFVTNTDGLLVDVTGFRGIAQIRLHVLEDASQANTEKLDVTVHNVADDDEATAAGNQVAAFDQIVGSNDGATIDVSQSLAVNLDSLTSTKKYLQLKFAETNTYECMISAEILLPGKGYLPVNG